MSFANLNIPEDYTTRGAMSELDNDALIKGRSGTAAMKITYEPGTPLFSIMEHGSIAQEPVVSIPQRRVTSVQAENSGNFGQMSAAIHRQDRHCFSLDESALQHMHRKLTTQATSEG